MSTEQLLCTDIAPDPDARAPTLLVPLSSWVMPRQLLSLIYTIKIVLLSKVSVKTWKGNSWDSPWTTGSNHHHLASLWVGSILKKFDFRWLALDEDVDVLTNSKTEFCTWHSKRLLMLLAGMGEPACPHWEQGGTLDRCSRCYSHGPALLSWSFLITLSWIWAKREVNRDEHYFFILRW